eukprot:TRINITY_DN102713_c0_g1_i1.p1 TRINITY_DN102713_c0_g1~~TRINITY_DN102713_c0_g1_i1.p1  ORF type:complete len:430 (-),score=79.58 TRINITY_DN102713_c0_g1_i1:29-1285(-)
MAGGSSNLKERRAGTAAAGDGWVAAYKGPPDSRVESSRGVPPFGAAETWTDAGISSEARPWHPAVAFVGTVLGGCLLVAALPFLLPLAFVLTVCEGLRDLLRLDAKDAAVYSKVEGSNEDVTLVLPGTCAYVFWQLGMMQYLCERFDTRKLKFAGVSSGAIAALLAVALEEAAVKAPERPAEAVRARAHEIFQLVEQRSAHLVSWPLGFMARLGTVLDGLADEILPPNLDYAALSQRLRVGVRRLAYSTGLPALVPDMVAEFNSRDDLESAVLASSSVWLVTRLFPCRYVPSKAAFCNDGVNPFSLYCFMDYLCQMRGGAGACMATRTAPVHTHSGGLDRIYAIWNCTVMRVLLPSHGKHVWVTPTIGGQLDVRFCLRVSGWFIAEQWRQGYAHARDLDSQGHWASLRRHARKSAAAA